MRNITDPTSPPVAECKNGLAANVISSFDDLAHSKAFFLIEDTRGKQSLGRDVYASSRIALKNLFLINEPLAETADGRPRLVLMARTVECTEKDFNGSSCDSTSGFHATACTCASRRRIPVPCTRNKREFAFCSIAHLEWDSACIGQRGRV